MSAVNRKLIKGKTPGSPVRLDVKLQRLEQDRDHLLARLQSKETRLSILHGRINRNRESQHDRETSMVEILAHRNAITKNLEDELMKQQKLLNIRSERWKQLVPAWQSTYTEKESTMGRDREHLNSEFEDRMTHAQYELQAVNNEYQLICDAVPAARRDTRNAMNRARRMEIELELMSESLSMHREHKLHSVVEHEYLTNTSELNRLRNLIAHMQAEKVLLVEDETRAFAQRNVLRRAMENQRQLDQITDRVETWNTSPSKDTSSRSSSSSSSSSSEVR